MNDDTRADDACPGCGCTPGDGVTLGCTHPDGCGYFAETLDDSERDGCEDYPGQRVTGPEDK